MNNIYLNSINLLKDVHKKGLFHLLFSNGFIQITAFGAQLFVAWLLLPIDIGRLKIMQSYLGIFTVLAGFGINSSVLKLCSEKRTIQDKKYLFIKGLLYSLISTLFIFIVLEILNIFNVFSTDLKVKDYFYFYSLIIIPMTINQIFIAFIQAIKHFKIISKIQSSSKVLSVLLIIFLSYLYGVFGFIFATFIGFSITTIMLIIYLRKKGYLSDISKVSDRPFSQHWQYSKFSVLANLSGQTNLYIFMILLNYLVPDRTEIGYYGFAMTLVMGLRIITTTIQQVSSPFFSEKSENKQNSIIKYNYYNRILVISSIIIGIFVILISPIIINFVFNSKYDNSIFIFQLLVTAWVIKNFYSLKGIVLWGFGLININFYNSLQTLIISIIPTFFLIKYYNVIGAAYSTILSNIIGYFIVSFYFKRFRKLNGI